MFYWTFRHYTNWKRYYFWLCFRFSWLHCYNLSTFIYISKFYSIYVIKTFTKM